MFRCITVLFFALALGLPASGAPVSPLKTAFPVGAYLSWSDGCSRAASNQCDPMTFLETLFKRCRERNLDFIWLVNIDWDSLPRALDLARKYDLALVVQCMDGKNASYYENDAAELKGYIARNIQTAGDNPYLTDWVLSDEPSAAVTQNLAYFRQLLKEADPGRGAGVVYMPRNLSEADSDFYDFIACDAYPFYAPGDPNGPHTPASSRNFYTNALRTLVTRCKSGGAMPMAMPQAFSDVIDGPYIYNEKSELVGLPGSYVHSVMPTEAQIRWQCWEALRVGTKGICFFHLTPILDWNNEKTARNPPPGDDSPWKGLARTDTFNAGPGGLVGGDGEATRQFDEIGKFVTQIEPFRALIQRWEPVPDFVHWSNGASGIFRDPQDGGLYAVIVNDDFEKTRTITLEWPGKVLPPHELLPGEGAVVPLEIRQNP